MTKVEIDKSDSAIIKFSSDNKKVYFYQTYNGDLYLNCCSNPNIKLEIDETENSEAYICFENLYHNIENGILENHSDRYNLIRNKLFDGKNINIKSDLSFENSLSIIKENNKYILDFNNDNEPFILCIKHANSRYESYYLVFKKLYNDLSNMYEKAYERKKKYGFFKEK